MGRSVLAALQLSIHRGSQKGDGMMNAPESTWGKEFLLKVQDAKRVWAVDERPLIDGSLSAPDPFDLMHCPVGYSSKCSQNWNTLQYLCNIMQLGADRGSSTAQTAGALKARGTKGMARAGHGNHEVSVT